jgi:predicted DNA-binding transcriptional regulator AlpA
LKTAPHHLGGELPTMGYVRLSQLIGRPAHPPTAKRPNGKPAIHGILPFSGPTLWRKVRDGKFPRPVKLGPNTTAWKVSDIQAWMAAMDAAGTAATGEVAP